MAGGGAGAGGGDGDAGDGDDGLDWRWCGGCEKLLYCQESWFILHEPACVAYQARIREKMEQNLARDRAQRLDKQRRTDRRKGKAAEVDQKKKKAAASSKGKAENPKRSG